MGQEEVVVAPALEARVEAVVVARAAVAQRAVEVGCVGRDDVIRRQVGAAAEPAAIAALDVAHVGVHRRDARALRVEDQRDPGGAEALALAGQRARHLRPQGAVHVGERDARLLEGLPVGEHARTPAAARGPRPRILAEAAAPVDGLDPGRDPVLQLLKELGRAIVEGAGRLRHRQACLAFAGFSAAIRRPTSRKLASRLRRFSKK